MPHSRKIAVIGLGYVGLPVAVSFAASNVPVIGFDIDARRITELNTGHDRTNEVESARLKQKSLTFTDDRAALKQADFFIVTVPTPIHRNALIRAIMFIVLKRSRRLFPDKHQKHYRSLPMFMVRWSLLAFTKRRRSKSRKQQK